MDESGEGWENSSFGIGPTERMLWESIDGETRKKKVAEAVRYMLCAERRKVPVSRTELRDKVVGGEFSRMLKMILHGANEELKRVFALEVREVVRGSSKYYLLVNLLPDDKRVSDILQWSKAERAIRGLLYVVLGIVFMKQGQISGENLWNTLDRLGLPKDRRHRLLGDVQKLVSKDFVDQMYLMKEKKVTDEKTQFLYRLGPRANEILDKKQFLKTTAELYGANLADWERQFEITQ